MSRQVAGRNSIGSVRNEAPFKTGEGHENVTRRDWRRTLSVAGRTADLSPPPLAREVHTQWARRSPPGSQTDQAPRASPCPSSFARVVGLSAARPAWIMRRAGRFSQLGSTGGRVGRSQILGSAVGE